MILWLNELSLWLTFLDGNRKLVKYPGETELRIFKLLSKYIKDPLQARKFIDNLLPFLGKKAQNSGKTMAHQFLSWYLLYKHLLCP